MGSGSRHTIPSMASCTMMTPASSVISATSVVEDQAATPVEAAATTAQTSHLRAGETASRIADYAELFKVRVTALVVMTAWAGFYLGSMRSGISSMQSGLIAAL